MTVQIEELSEGVIHLIMTRPEALNALNSETLKELSQLLYAIGESPQIKAVILSGSGEKAFSAGADIKEMSRLSSQEALLFCETGQRVTQQLSQSSFITIAAVHGYALGGGFEMALACDWMFATKPSRFSLPEVVLGIIPGFGGTQLLARRSNSALALELLATGRSLSAEEALQKGIVNTLFSTKEELFKHVQEVAHTIAKQPAFALQQAKKAVKEGLGGTIELGLELERNCCALCFGPEQQARMRAFIQKKG